MELFQFLGLLLSFAGKTDTQIGNSDYSDNSITLLKELCRQGLSPTTLLALSTASWKWNGNTLASQVSQLMISSIQIPS